MSPSRPPTAKATIIDKDDGSMSGGHNASRKSEQDEYIKKKQDREANLGDPICIRLQGGHSTLDRREKR